MLSVKKKLLRTKYALGQTIQRILEINKKRKKLPFFRNKEKKEEVLEYDLVVLNKIADKQARLIKKYEYSISKEQPSVEEVVSPSDQWLRMEE